ncbi:MAG TPA: NAD(P)/FAD-dependent oxidoreductase [bacterium]|nr:NAD(P)/FAD-dependent oxidoreductase [bacterium]
MTNSGKRIIVVGGGASGLLAAGRAAQRGADVVLLEKMPACGRKLRISGKGRCNLTNISPVQAFLSHFGPNARFLKPAFGAFFSEKLIDLLDSLGVATVTERGGRVFPASQDARDVVAALTHFAEKNGVRIVTRHPVRSLVVQDNRAGGVVCRDGSEWPADAVILAAGGSSYPATGSIGDGIRLAKAAGHAFVPVRPALVPLITDGDQAQRLQGISLRNVNASLWCDGRKAGQAFGEMLFTHFGLSGPIILTLSRRAVDLLDGGKTPEIAVDFKPALDEKKFDARLLREFEAHGKQHLKSTLKSLLPQRVVPVCLDAVRIDPDKPGNQITADERKRLRLWLKGFRLRITGHRGWQEAIITAGGVALDEIHSRTLESVIVKGLYFAGEVMDVDADTGGYNLQAAFSTGWLAGQSAAG